jgi:hypothetical protein
VGREQDGHLVGEAALDAVAQAYELHDVQMIVGCSLTLVVLDGGGELQLTSFCAWEPPA